MKKDTGLFKLPARTFVSVKVLSSPDLVLAALAPLSYGTPRDIAGALRGAPLPADGRALGRRAILYRVELDGWTTIVREGEPIDAYDPLLAKRLSRVLGTRAIALWQQASFLTESGACDLVYDIFDKGVSIEGVLATEGEIECSGTADAASVKANPLAHARALLAREKATNDRISFADFERGTIRGRWDLVLDRAILLPELAPVGDEVPVERKRTSGRVEASLGETGSDARSDQARLSRLFGTIVDEDLSTLNG